MTESQLLDRIVTDPRIFGGKPIIRGRRLAVEHVLGMLAARDDVATILAHEPRLEADDVRLPRVRPAARWARAVGTVFHHLGTMRLPLDS